MGWGDEMMAAGEAAALGGKVCIKGRSGEHRWNMAWENNPKIAKPNERYDHFITNGPGARPYAKVATDTAWQWLPYRPKPAKFYFSAEEEAFADSLGEGFVIVEPGLKAKVESVNRDWGWDNFAKVTSAIDADWVQLGERQPKLLPNARWIQTPNQRYMAAALSRAKTFLSPEGGIHHTAAAFGLKGVVLFGGFISPHVTGYTFHKNIFIGSDLGCGKRVKCQHCADAWGKIDPERIIKIMQGLLK